MGSDAYTVTAERNGSYHLHSTTPENRHVARITPVLDRSAHVLGWKLKPVVVMQGATSKLWRDPAEAIAATKLLTPGRARAAVRTAAAALEAAYPSGLSPKQETSHG